MTADTAASAPHIEDVVDRLDLAETTRTPVGDDGTWPALTLDEAYTAQAGLFARRTARGEHEAGLKLGFTSAAKMRQMGVSDLIVGRLTDAMRIAEGSVLDPTALIHPRVEPEVAFRVGLDVDLADPDADLLSSVEAVAPAMEIIDSRYEGFRFDLPRVVADNTSAARYVIGMWAPLDPLALGNLGVALRVDGQDTAFGSTSAILGHPMRTLTRLQALGGRLGLRLRAGAVVLAGAATAAVPLPLGHVEVAVSTLGRAGIHVEGARHE
ncbi:4-oxalocrotonate decarboxylase [Streptomyces sp. NPDC096057]|uniref:2-keto-4-pentenoate hydratase n=1 Tax=Streptomyces sp. NPDC096057 TaxID=3155543 RepID=UPI00332289A6